MSNSVIIGPSVLSADFLNLGRQLKELEDAIAEAKGSVDPDKNAMVLMTSGGKVSAGRVPLARKASMP